MTELLRRGVQLRQEGRDEAALREFDAASRLSHEPRITAQIALAEQALQRWLDADRHLREALSAGGDVYIARHRAVLEGALRDVDRHLASVLVTGGTPGAEVWLNGEHVGTLPMQDAAQVSPGDVALEVRAAGHATTTRNLTVAAGETLREEVASSNRPAERSRSALRVTAPLAARPPALAPPSGSARGTAGWVLLVGGVALTAGGMAGLVVADVNATSFNSNRLCRVDPSTNLVWGGLDCMSDYDAGSTARVVGIIGLAGGAVSLIAGIIILATAPSRQSPHEAANSFSCGQGPGSIGIECGGRF
ncbi:MAG: hypothetical protein Q8S73_44885 [Deltaproteobacteria bacterium]|nr:hypothetical protein [Myxococcales bacterium]MDP3221303.1 hypothetical protein [Deltaproteobacteria bacterium]